MVTEKKHPTPGAVITETGYIVDAQPELLTEDGRALLQSFEQNRDTALYQLGLTELPGGAEPAFRYLQLVSAAFFRCLTHQSELELARERVCLTQTEDEVQALLEAIPFVIGAEWVDADWIRARFSELLAVFAGEIQNYEGTVELYFTEKNQRLRVPERIFFHLVENREDEEYPFAFLATYASETETGRVRHMPLEYALTEYAGNREKLLALLACLNRVSEVSELIGGFIESGELFHPLRLTAEEAYEFLRQIGDIEACGVLCRIPNWWKRRHCQPGLSVKMGGRKPSSLGFDALVSLQPQISLDGTPLASASTCLATTSMATLHK